MSNRLKPLLAGNASHKLLVPFFTAGYPNINSTAELFRTACDAGADIIELGIPFSDPMADGPEIQFSSKMALDNGVTLKKILVQVESLRSSSRIPIMLMGYYNPILAFGEDRFLSAARNAGVDGLIIPDLPLEEAEVLRSKANRFELALTFLVAPTTTSSRLKLIDNLTTGFVYAVTVTGVTGTGKQFGPETIAYLKKLRKTLRKRYIAGFGIDTPAAAKTLAEYSDGVVIGSALIKIIRQSSNSSESVKGVGDFLKSTRRALDE